MADDFQFNGQGLTNELVTSVSSLLDTVEIPHLLWGNYLLTIYGVPTIVDVSILFRFSKTANHSIGYVLRLARQSD